MCDKGKYVYLPPNHSVMASKKVSLAIERIDSAAQEFIGSRPAYTICIKECNKGSQKQIEITHTKNNERGILNCFISGGQVSHNIQGKYSSLNQICKECWEHIVKQTSIPIENQKCFTLKNVPDVDFETFIQAVKDYNGVEVAVINSGNNPNIISQYHLKGAYGAKISVIYYKNGTLFVQGCVTSFYVEFITEILQCVSSVPTEMIKEVFAIQTQSGYAINPDIDTYIKDRTHTSGSVIEKFLATSINIANSAAVVEDYGCYTFGALKALDAVLRTRILEDVPEFDTYGEYFQKGATNDFCFKNSVQTFDNNPNLKAALETGYSFFNQHRHTTFHVDKLNIETSRILEYDEAINIIKECLVIINNICNNW